MRSEPVYIPHFGGSVLVAVRHAMCSDGKRRYVRITAQPDTMFSVPGQVKVGRKTVTGFVTVDSNAEGGPEYEFTANRFGKNGHLLPREEC